MMIQQMHHLQGRTRFKIEGLYASQMLKSCLESRLSQKSEVLWASANPRTGNLLVRYDAGNTPDMIAAAIEEIVIDYIQALQKQMDSGNPAAAQAVDHPDSGTSVSVSAGRRIKTKLKSLFHTEVQQAEPWHQMSVEEILDMFASCRERGLSAAAGEANHQKYGPNRLPEMQKPSQIRMLAGQFTTLPVGLLAAAAGVSLATGGLLDALLIMGVVSLNAAIGYLTESKAEKTISSLKTLVKPVASVIREGRQTHISADKVVPGDLLILKPGAYVAADSRVVSASHLSVDESALTGESMPVLKAAETLAGISIPIADRSNMVFMGTLVTGGQGLAVVVATGRFTAIGQLQEMVGEAQTPQTPLEKQLNHVGNQLVMVSAGICGLVFGIGLLRGYTLMQMMRTAISLAAAAVPEGLTAVATTTLAFGMNALRRHHVLIRKLGAVETLGAVQTICLDKTGTLTLNEMSVIMLFAGMKEIRLQGARFYQEGEPVDPLQYEEVFRLMQVSVLCSDTRVLSSNGTEISGNNRKNKLRGSPTENALVLMAMHAGMDVKQMRKEHPLLHVTHRSENRLFMNTLHESPEYGRLEALKGSPSEVLEMCGWQLNDGALTRLTDEDREAIQRENERMAGRALRVLGMAYAVHEEGNGIQENAFVWLGLAGMADPVRQGVKSLIRVFHRAGVKTVMLTGDQSSTAYAVAKDLNLSEGSQVKILEASYLEEMDPEALQALVQRVHVFARISPSHKLQIVRALQEAGQVIAMTGDGINDSPALKSADIGIAMGEGGTDIAREVADVVLEKDDLETLVIAIEGGRAIYENIRKAVHFLAATNLSEIMVTFACIAGGLGAPLNAMQLLWINTLSDIFPALALSMAPAEPGVMNEPPRDSKARIIGNQDLKRMTFESSVISGGALGAYGYGLMRYGPGARAGTLAFQGLTIGQLLHTLSCRSEKRSVFDKTNVPSSGYLYLALGGSFVLQAFSMFVPGLRRLLGVTPLSLLDTTVVGSSAIVPLIINEGTKKTVFPKGKSNAQEAAP